MSFFEVNKVRRSTAVTTNGPGALVDARAGKAAVSGIHAGLETWDKEAPLKDELEHQRIFERRLLSRLRKKYFRLPPVLDNSEKVDAKSSGIKPSLLLTRFPNWLQCPNCSIIKPAVKWKNDPGEAYRICPTCTSEKPGEERQFVAPVRLVVACTKGHLDDFPWNWWVRHNAICDPKQAELKLYASGAGLGAFELKCLKCGAQRSMESAFNKSALNGLVCSGKRPWLETDDPGCVCSGGNGDYRALQRGASNLYYPSFESALDIPPWSEPIQDILNDRWDDLLHIPNKAQRITWIKNFHSVMEAAQRIGYTAEDIVEAFEKMQALATSVSESDLRTDEFRVFNSKAPFQYAEFEAYPSIPTGILREYFSSISRVARLREVRVLKGFSRIRPPLDSKDSELAPLSEKPLVWLPAIEIRGEGIFIAVDREKLIAWSNQEKVKERASKLEHGYQEEMVKRYPELKELPHLSARKLLLHSLSHVVMRQLTLECGYSSASLRERLYVDDANEEMSGILIYTGTADSDGTLGGLQARGEEKLLKSTIQGSIQASMWCSSDPICIEGQMAPPEMHSGASCHSCLLAPETSCEFFNKFLDRAFLVGTVEDSSLGFFSELLDG